jgi:predicted RNase H-like HicB family nuclease
MEPVFVTYHHEDDGWWADSQQVTGWSATAETLDALRVLVEEGVRFALERDDIVIEHVLSHGLTSQARVLFDFVQGQTIFGSAVESDRQDLTLVAG